MCTWSVSFCLCVNHLFPIELIVTSSSLLFPARRYVLWGLAFWQPGIRLLYFLVISFTVKSLFTPGIIFSPTTPLCSVCLNIYLPSARACFLTSFDIFIFYKYCLLHTNIINCKCLSNSSFLFCSQIMWFFIIFLYKQKHFLLGMDCASNNNIALYSASSN